jgi:hypothetical protein
MTKLDISKTGSLDSIIDKYKTLLILLNLMMLKGQIVFVDFKKAFDSLEWIFILTTLKHFGFNEPFLIWVKTLYSNIQITHKALQRKLMTIYSTNSTNGDLI